MSGNLELSTSVRANKNVELIVVCCSFFEQEDSKRQGTIYTGSGLHKRQVSETKEYVAVSAGKVYGRSRMCGNIVVLESIFMLATVKKKSSAERVCRGCLQ